MSVSYTTATRNARLDLVRAQTQAYLQIWGDEGSIPATPDAAPVSSVLLASLAMTATNIAPAASGGVLTMSAIADDTTANASGTPQFARIATTETGTTDGVVQMSAGLTAEDLVFDAAIVAGGTVSVTSLTITDGSATTT